MPRARRRAPRPLQPPDNLMKGMVDVSRMAVAGAVTIGTIGVVGSLFRK